MTDGQSEACRLVLEDERRARIELALRLGSPALSIDDQRWLYSMAFGEIVKGGPKHDSPSLDATLD